MLESLVTDVVWIKELSLAAEANKILSSGSHGSWWTLNLDGAPLGSVFGERGRGKIRYLGFSIEVILRVYLSVKDRSRCFSLQ